MENEKTEIFKNLARKRYLKIFVNVRKLPVDVVQKKNPPPTFLEHCTFDILKTSCIQKPRIYKMRPKYGYNCSFR